MQIIRQGNRKGFSFLDSIDISRISQECIPFRQISKDRE